MSLKFLGKKRFNPSNHANIKKVWIAEQKHEAFKKKEEQRAKELAKERARMEDIALLRGKSIDQQQLEFMYKPPPGLEEYEKKLESQKEVERSAPVEADYVRGMNVQVKPFGIEVRNVTCVRCGEKGHMLGDRECKLYNSNDGINKRNEDPLYRVQKDIDPFIQESNLILKEHLRKDMEGIKSNLLDLDDDPEKEFLDSLSRKEKKKLLKYLLKKEKKAKRKESKSKKESKKRKRNDEDDTKRKRSKR